MKAFFSSTLFLFTLVTLANYSPRIPLNQLIDNADLIVIAKVKNSEYRIEEYNFANLIIQKTIKGEKFHQNLYVQYTKLMTCPPPPIYKDSSTVLTFLKLNRDSTYQTVGGSVGSIELDSTTSNTYRNLILEYLSFSRINNSYIRKEKYVDWLTNCISFNKTIWDGYITLYKNTNLNSFIFQQEYQITTEQKDKLEQTILSIKRLDFDESKLVYFIVNSPSKKVTPFLITQLKLTYYGYTDDVQILMKAIIQRTNNNKLKAIYNEYSNLDFDEDKKRKYLQNKFIKNIKI